MTLYSKHTNGEAFTLNGEDYVGFFHLKDGVVYSGRTHTSESEILSEKGNFLSDVYSGGCEMDTTFRNISGLTEYFPNVFDLLNKQGLDKSFGTVDHNNLICFKNLILGHPTIYQFEENGGYYYGLSAVNDDYPTGKTSTIHIDPFSLDDTWSFMDSVITGTFVVNSEDEFKYICSTGTKNYVLSGSFSNKKPLGIIYELDQHPDYTYNPDYTYTIYNDEENKRFLFVNTDYINIYDSSNYDECDNLVLVDRISLGETTTQEYIWNRTHLKWGELKEKWTTKFSINNSNNPQFIKFGKNLRTSIKNNVLYLINKYSSDIYNSIDLSDLGDVLSLDIRDIDDNIIILHKKSGNFYVYIIDPQDLTNFRNIMINDIKDGLDSYTVKFSNIDTNVFFTSNKSEFQSRFLSNPKYPSGRMETSDLYYPEKLKWGEISQPWEYYKLKWNSGKELSNSYNNLLVSQIFKNGNMYLLLHNIGRLYVVKQPPNDRFLNALPLDLSKYYNGITCSESSFGLYFNSTISNLVKDILNIYNQSTGSFNIEESSVFSKQLENFVLEVDNLYINGNETPNVVSLQRIFSTILGIQNNLLPVTVEN